MLPTLNGTLHITALLISIVWELYSICDPINDRVMHLEPINTKYNLAREVLAHIARYLQLQRAVSTPVPNSSSILTTLSHSKLFPSATVTLSL